MSATDYDKLGHWSKVVGTCKDCGSQLWTRFPVRAWEPGDGRFTYMVVCPTCDGFDP